MWASAIPSGGIVAAGLRGRRRSQTRREFANIRRRRRVGCSELVCYHVIRRKEKHLRPLVDQQSAKPKRRNGPQRWRQDVLRFVAIAGDGEAQRVLERGLQVGTRAPESSQCRSQPTEARPGPPQGGATRRLPKHGPPAAAGRVSTSCTGKLAASPISTLICDCSIRPGAACSTASTACGASPARIK